MAIKASNDVASVANQIPVSGKGGDGREVDPGKDRKAEPFCGDFEIRIGRDGTWYYHGSPIGRKELVKLFASVLQRDKAGDYWLVTPVERGRIEVEDAPFTAVELTLEGDGRDQNLHFRTNLDEVVTAGPEHPIRVVRDEKTEEPRPYILVRAGRHGLPGFEALIVRAVYYQLVEHGVEENQDGDCLFGVWSRGQFFPLGKPEH